MHASAEINEIEILHRQRVNKVCAERIMRLDDTETQVTSCCYERRIHRTTQSPHARSLRPFYQPKIPSRHNVHPYSWEKKRIFWERVTVNFDHDLDLRTWPIWVKMNRCLGQRLISSKSCAESRHRHTHIHRADCSGTGHWSDGSLVRGVCSVLFLSRPRSQGWPHHGRRPTFFIYLYPLSFWLTVPQRVLSTTWCCLSRPWVVFLACVHLALFLALFLSPGNSRFLMVWPCFDSV